METRANFALIGAMVIASLVGFALFTLWLGQSQFNRDFDIYDIVFEGPVSLESGASVRFNGINVGEVTAVMIDRTNDQMVRARIRVSSDTPVRTDSVATIDFAGITGLTFVQIMAGSTGAPLLTRAPGAPIPEIQSIANPLAEVFDSGAKIIDNANQSMESLRNILSDENAEALTRILQNISIFMESLNNKEGLAEDMVNSLASIAEASEDFSELSRTLTELARTAESDINTVSKNLSLIIEDLRGTSQKIDTFMVTANETVGTAKEDLVEPAIAAMADFRLLVQDVKLLIQRLDNLTREVEQNPQSIIYGTSKPYEEEARP